MDKNITLIPIPKKYDIGCEKTLVPCAVFSRNELFKSDIDVFCDYFRKINDIQPKIAPGGIELILDSAVRGDGYILDSREGIKLRASTGEGMRYALASVLQLAGLSGGKIAVDKMLLEDYPDKDYRGLMVDLARLWHPLHTILRYIDVCYYYKIKYIHLHFIDDQIYSLPSRVFPEISTKGKSYSFEDIEVIKAYALDRGIIIIPEVEVPGHARALISAYPHVFGNKFTDGCKSVIVTEQGDLIDAGNIVCAGSNKALNSVKALIQEVCDMFPASPYIHIGGDEANIKAWNDCADCVRYMKENNISDEYELYSDYIARVAQMVIDYGRIPIVWEGFPKKGAERVPRETIVIAWESHYHMAYDLLEEGFNIINCSWQPLYIIPGTSLRWDPYDILGWSVYNWQHWWPHSEARLNPINVAPTDAVLGGQLCSWECTYEQEINFVMENLSAVAERTWSVKRIRDDKEYMDILRPVLHKLAKIIVEYIFDKR
ncbi:MAG: family 20 glycosylhydrolase [Clostridiales bacterium]|nr:family 20 glycosylhydrolase [Clostridiales bacterium]